MAASWNTEALGKAARVMADEQRAKHNIMVNQTGGDSPMHGALTLTPTLTLTLTLTLTRQAGALLCVVLGFELNICTRTLLGFTAVAAVEAWTCVRPVACLSGVRPLTIGTVNWVEQLQGLRAGPV
jgi:hypothetical protein